MTAERSEFANSGNTGNISFAIDGPAGEGKRTIAKEISKAARLVEISGMNLAAALAKAGRFPPMMLQLIEVGIGSGKITDVLDKIAEQYEKEVDISLKRITSLIEPVMIVVVGILAGTVVISIFLPMFSMVDNMGV